MAPVQPDTLRRALAGERAAIRTLVDELTPAIQTRVARLLLRSGTAARRGSIRQEVDDLTQSVFELLFADDGQALRSFDPTRGLSLSRYVSLVAEREVISILRSRRRSPYTEDPTETLTLEARAPSVPPAEGEVLTRLMTHRLFARLRDTLSPLGMRVFERLFCDEETPEAVCDELGMSHDALYAWRSRIRKTARELASEISTDREAWAEP